MRKVVLGVFIFILAFVYPGKNVVASSDTNSSESTASITIQQSNDVYMQGVNQFNQSLIDARTSNQWSGEQQSFWSGKSLVNWMNCEIGGYPCGAKDSTEQSKYSNGSLLGMTSKSLALLYVVPPTSTTEYLADVFNNAGLIPKTYAQGVTYSRMLPLLPIWKTFRNISYILLTLVMLIIGLMIMFRQKINANAVASVENTLPNVIITLLLITFSFPIATLILDCMYIAIAAGIGLIGEAVGDVNVKKAITDFSTGGVGTFFTKALSPVIPSLTGTYGWSNALGFAGITTALLTPLFESIGPVGWIACGLLGAFGIGAGVAGGVNGNDALGGALAGILSPIFVFLVLIILFVAFFRIFFTLLICYINIILYIVFSPILLLPTAINGGSSFNSWWKNIAANASCFVTTALVLYLGWAINFTVSKTNQAIWTPPLVSGVPGLSQMAVALISIGLALQVPQMTAKVKELFKVKPAVQLSPTMVIAPATNILRGGWGSVGTVANWQKFKEGLKELPLGLGRIFRGNS